MSISPRTFAIHHPTSHCSALSRMGRKDSNPTKKKKKNKSAEHPILSSSRFIPHPQHIMLSRPTQLPRALAHVHLQDGFTRAASISCRTTVPIPPLFYVPQPYKMTRNGRKGFNLPRRAHRIFEWGARPSGCAPHADGPTAEKGATDDEGDFC